MTDNTMPACPGPDNPLRQYAEQAWARPGVASLLLHLQDNHGLCINLLLCLIWLDTQPVEPDPAQWQTLQQAIGSLEYDVLQPLRQARRHLSGEGLDDCYAAMKQLELALEFEALDRLYQACRQFPATHETLRQQSHLSLYASAATADVRACLDRLASLANPPA